MFELMDALIALCVSFASRILAALAVYFVGKIIINKILDVITKMRSMEKLETTVKNFILSAVKLFLYVILVISIVSVLGVPMASVIAVLASAGVAVGMALQGSLSNLAGGIMLLILHPFKVGDYVKSAGGEGTVKEINLFYTILTTTDNRQVIIPNGSLMNANVENYSAEPTRRVDLTFNCAKGEDTTKIQQMIVNAMCAHDKVLHDPEPVAKLASVTNEAMTFTARAWVNNADYWDVFFDLNKRINDTLTVEGIQAPAIRVITETK